MKVAGGKLPSAWDRFDRLQRTVAAIRPQPDAYGLSLGSRARETFVRETGGSYAKPDPPRESDLVALCRAAAVAVWQHGLQVPVLAPTMHAPITCHPSCDGISCNGIE